MRVATSLAMILAIGLLPLSVAAQDATPEPDAETAPEAPAATETAPEAPATAETGDDAPAASETGDDAEAATEAAPAAPGGSLSTGEDVSQQGGNQIYIREEHGAFEVRCLRAPEGQDDPCQLFQRLSDQEGNPTADVNFFDLPDGAELAGGATILTPLQTLLTAQVTMSIDGGQPRRYPFAFCDPAGCYARLGFTEEDLGQLRRGATARVVVVPALAPDQPAELDLSLSGFTAGFAAVEVSEE